MSKDYDCGICGESVDNNQYLVHQIPGTYAVYHSDCWNREVIEDSNAELRSAVETLRELQHDKADKAGEATSAQSRKYNQGAAYAYSISANTIEGVLDGE